MPETIRTTNGRLRSRPRRGLFLASVVALSAGLVADALAQSETLDATAFAGLSRHDLATLTLILGLLAFAVLTAIMLVRTWARSARSERDTRDETASLKSEIDCLKALLLSEPQVLIAWNAADEQPEILGDTDLIVAGSAQRVLAFGSWLDPASAQEMQHGLDTLRAQGRGFEMSLTSLAGRSVEAEGRAIGGRAVLRLRSVDGIKSELADLGMRHDLLRGDVETLRALIDALPSPIWARDETGRLTFVNAAYARAVEAADASEAVERGLELLDQAARAELTRAHHAGATYAGRMPVIAAGSRRTFDVIDAPTGRGSVGVAIDATEVETIRADMARMVDANRRVFDQLATGIAVFAADQTLTFYNDAFRALWELDAGFLDQMPTDLSVLEQLRAARKLPEEQDFRQWKNQLHEAYRALEPKEHVWHLPDGRTLRVITTPNPEGGVTYLYHDVTERLDLVRRYDALIKVQRETLDHLAEAVAVFGSDGRIRLHNSAFESMWKLTPEALSARPHIEAVTAWCQAQHDDNAVWRTMRAAVTAIDEREPTVAQIERRDGVVIDCTTMPLPDGATLVTFQDVTDTVNVERALRERNEALETADKIKLDFVHHVSYELRSPLTNVIGFTHFLGDPAFGPLTDKQSEYLGYVTASTNALLAIVNNILDLATIDAGAMTLNIGTVDVRATMQGAAEGVQDRLVKDNIRLDIRAASNIGSFTGDERRVRQVLFNLLSNAVGFSPPNETVVLSAERSAQAVVFTVTDHGPGIPPDKKDKMFEWFETDSRGSQHRGAGLGLSLVRSFVELHGGSVDVDSVVGRTTVTCTFPLEQTLQQSAA